ncbi:hypothetical protein ACOSP7_013968 [Xanthoceras sorbifolium]|uniref:F-box domain-containing protein n=1 Tax=Xanthoceras sorbifolium TaxID=99658 RepID=A0ABQ8I463_9ROSI|nr:hypothetical protein JRO89_XS04G0044900 [Xanthoceras sorbifolium]
MMSGILELPEGCIAAAISFTSPRDACRLACVSTTFRSAAESDAVWDHFLPPEYLSAISGSGSGAASSSSSSSTTTSSKKELYLRACHNPILINGGKLSFWLDKPSGKKCYMISARELKIVWSSTPEYWGWISLPEARFPEVAELRSVCWFEIRGEISTSLLSPMTTYVPYLVFKPTEESFGFGNNPVEVTVGLSGSEGQNRTVYLDTREQRDILFYLQLPRRRFKRGQASVPPDDRGFSPEKRGDGWLEIELGEFFYGGEEEGDLSMSILEVKRGNWKQGLVFQGIEIRPKKKE